MGSAPHSAACAAGRDGLSVSCGAAWRLDLFFFFIQTTYNLAVAKHCNIPIFTGVFWEVK
jgi:hypothetical protein